MAAALSPTDAWKAMVDDKNPLNWFCLQVNASKQLEVTHTGEAGLTELKAKFEEKEIQWFAIRVVAVDQQANVTSKRNKIVCITVASNTVPAMRRMQVLQQQPNIEKIMHGVSLKLEAASPDDVTAAIIGRGLLAGQGAHKPTHYEFGGGETLQLKEISG